MAGKDGINMLDVKIRNRCSILELIYQSRQIPRKDIAKALGLTPAAITLITNDLIREGILVEKAKKESQARGRREVLLEIQAGKFSVIGVNITRHHYEILCTDLSTKELYHKRVSTMEYHSDANLIMDAIAKTIEKDILSSSVLKKKKLLSIGISTLGIVQTELGISLNSYGVFHGQAALKDFFENRFSVPVIVTNNICADAHAEAFLKKTSVQSGSLLFIKYGPGIGSAMIRTRDYFNIYDYKAVQIGHTITEPFGQPCICGNSGCLETVVSYPNVISELYNMISPETTPELYEAWKHVPFNQMTLRDSGEDLMEHVFTSYDRGNAVVGQEIRRILTNMAVAIENAITLLNPQRVILYGGAFQHRRFRDALLSQLSVFTRSQKVGISEFNMKLDALGPVTAAISLFFLNGGRIPDQNPLSEAALLSDRAPVLSES